jgi:hypothetical protein
MALTKITKHVTYGSIIVQHKDADLSDMSSSWTTSWVNWGSAMTMTPLYNDSTLEIRFSGVTTLSMSRDNLSGMDFRITVNGIEEYFVERINGGYIGDAWNANRQGENVSAVHRHKPGSTNLQTVQVQLRMRDASTGGFNGYNGFLAIKEISSGISA